jgi:hypothetical protein
MIAALARGSTAIGVDLKPEYSGYTMERIRRDLGGARPRHSFETSATS